MFHSFLFKKWLPLGRWLDFLSGTVVVMLQLGVCEYLKKLLNIEANNAIFNSTLNRIA